MPIYCPYCRYYGPSTFGSETSTFGWIVFTFLLVTTCIGAPIGFLFTRTFRKCACCHTRLGQ
jgi:hypothetical protein